MIFLIVRQCKIKHKRYYLKFIFLYFKESYESSLTEIINTLKITDMYIIIFNKVNIA